MFFSGEGCRTDFTAVDHRFGRVSRVTAEALDYSRTLYGRPLFWTDQFAHPAPDHVCELVTRLLEMPRLSSSTFHILLLCHIVASLVYPVWLLLADIIKEQTLKGSLPCTLESPTHATNSLLGYKLLIHSFLIH